MPSDRSESGSDLIANRRDRRLGSHAVAAVEVEHLTVRHGTSSPSTAISFAADAGQITTVLGPNGAGKTSTIEVCEGYRRATAGTVRVLGLDPATQQRQLSKRMGVMLQEGGVYPSSTVLETVRHYASLYGNGADAAALVEAVGLTAKRKATWRQLSGGERQRLSLALALAAKPDVAFLDEPTSGVDINGRDAIRGIIRDLASNGCAVVLATHELDEAERLADRMVIIDHGTLIADGNAGGAAQGSRRDSVSQRPRPRSARPRRSDRDRGQQGRRRRIRHRRASTTAADGPAR